MADAFAYFGDPSTKETQHFIMMFDKWFDCLNVRSLHLLIHKRKPDLKPYTSVDDPRFHVSVSFVSNRNNVIITYDLMVTGGFPRVS